MVLVHDDDAPEKLSRGRSDLQLNIILPKLEYSSAASHVHSRCTREPYTTINKHYSEFKGHTIHSFISDLTL